MTEQSERKDLHFLDCALSEPAFSLCEAATGHVWPIC